MPSDETASEPATATAALIEQGMQAHRAGRADEAEALYARVLEAEPEHPDALHLTGLVWAQRRQMARAAGFIDRAIAAKPDEAMFHNNRGNVAVEQGDADKAEAHYRRAVELDPGRLDAFNNLGVLFSRRGDGERAASLLSQVLEVAPGFDDARQNLVAHHLRQGDLQSAIDLCLGGLVVQPRHKGLRRLLGMAYSLDGRRAEAAAVYRAWLADEPGHPIAAHHLRACEDGEVPERASDAYVSEIFDDFAGSFDAKLTALGYRAPALVGAAVAAQLGEARGALDVLDAGCGTGLCAPLLRAHARRLEGVDLSAGMLDRARQRGGYDALFRAELVAHLRERAGAFDLVVSADTLCYFGALEAFAEAAAGALRPGGALVFTVEALLDGAPGQPYRLEMHGRYSHRADYVERVLAEAGFGRIERRAEVLRQEACKPVDGWLLAAERPRP